LIELASPLVDLYPAILGSVLEPEWKGLETRLEKAFDLRTRGDAEAKLKSWTGASLHHR
jgi:hypothetical protein